MRKILFILAILLVQNGFAKQYLSNVGDDININYAQKASSGEWISHVFNELTKSFDAECQTIFNNPLEGCTTVEWLSTKTSINKSKQQSKLTSAIFDNNKVRYDCYKGELLDLNGYYIQDIEIVCFKKNGKYEGRVKAPFILDCKVKGTIHNNNMIFQSSGISNKWTLKAKYYNNTYQWVGTCSSSHGEKYQMCLEYYGYEYM